MTDYTNLRMLAEAFRDLQECRISITNRSERAGIDQDLLAPTLEAVKRAEKVAQSGLRAEYRRTVPAAIRRWQEDSPGIGDHSVALLLGLIGDPVRAVPHWWEGEGDDRVLLQGEPFDRSVSQLWSLCGHGDPERKRRKGMTAEDAAALGNPRAKMIVHEFLAAKAVMQKCATCRANTRPGETWEVSKGCTDCPHYRQVYVARRAATASREWTDGHCANDALRITGKAILRDLWVAAGGGQAPSGTRTRIVAV